jgi:FkbM family methyltransferase
LNIRHFIGSVFSRVSSSILSSESFPLTRYVPRGVFSWYDVQRFANTRRFDTIFDVGANVGQTASGLLEYFPAARVYCFEPSKTAFETLTNKYGSKENLVLVNKALGSSCGSRVLHVSKSSELNTLVLNSPRIEQFCGIETVEIDTIDNYAANNNVHRIDILKIDVQGWELEVIIGARSQLENHRIRFIFSEVGFFESDRDMTQFVDFHKAITRYDFAFSGLYDNFRWGLNKQYVGFANALYMNTHFVN